MTEEKSEYQGVQSCVFVTRLAKMIRVSALMSATLCQFTSEVQRFISITQALCNLQQISDNIFRKLLYMQK